MSRERERSRLVDLIHEVAAESADNFSTVIPRSLDFTDRLAEHFIANDVTLVKHGKWLINSDGYYPYCSECRSEPDGGKMSRYCPNCGARMDGDER